MAYKMKLIIISLFCVLVSAHFFTMGHYLLSLDESLTDILKNPINSSKTTDLLYYIQDYYNTFCDLEEKMNENIIGIDESVDVFMNNNGPQFLDVNINYNTIKDILKWNDSLVNNFKTLRTNIADLWKTFQIDVEKFRSEQPNVKLDLNQISIETKTDNSVKK